MIKLIEVYKPNPEDHHMHSSIIIKYIVVVSDKYGYTDYYEFDATKLSHLQHDLFYNYMFNGNVNNFIKFLYDDFGVRINGKHRTLKAIWALDRNDCNVLYDLI